MSGNSPLDGRMTEHPMTEATPLASEQITQDAEKVFDALSMLASDRRSHVKVMVAEALTAINRLEAAALSASPARSGQGVSGARDEATIESIRRLQFKVDFQRGYGADWFSLDRADADRILAALSASPAPSGQGVSGEPAAWLYEKNGKQSLQPKRQPWNTAPDRGWTETPLYAAPAPSCAPGEVERLRAAVKLTVADASHHLRKWRPHCLEALEAALSPQGLDAKEGGE